MGQPVPPGNHIYEFKSGSGLASKKIINVGILFGGKSAEHEVSLQSAKNIIQAIDREKYHPVLIGIDKTGRWLVHDEANYLLHADNPKLIKLNQSSRHVALVPQNEGKLTSLNGDEQLGSIDVIFPVLHGPYGEDGALQGLLKMADIPFVGAGVLGSAVGMDKEVMKRLLRDAHIPIAKFIPLRFNEIVPDYSGVSAVLGKPFFVKPANLGSSVGVNKVHSASEYQQAVNRAFEYDNKILIEENIKGREIECSVLGNDDPVASLPGEIIPHHEFYSYDAKYIDEQGAALEIPARLADDVIAGIQKHSIAVFRTLSCEGMARVDFFLRGDSEIIVNEINTIPGFTSISMYPRLWDASGIPYVELIDRLIQLAIERFKQERRIKTAYDAD